MSPASNSWSTAASPASRAPDARPLQYACALNSARSSSSSTWWKASSPISPSWRSLNSAWRVPRRSARAAAARSAGSSPMLAATSGSASSPAARVRCSDESLRLIEQRTPSATSANASPCAVRTSRSTLPSSVRLMGPDQRPQGDALQHQRAHHHAEGAPAARDPGAGSRRAARRRWPASPCRACRPSPPPNYPRRTGPPVPGQTPAPNRRNFQCAARLYNMTHPRRTATTTPNTAAAIFR